MRPERHPEWKARPASNDAHPRAKSVPHSLGTRFRNGMGMVACGPVLPFRMALRSHRAKFVKPERKFVYARWEPGYPPARLQRKPGVSFPCFEAPRPGA